MKLAYPVGTPETNGKLLAYQADFTNTCKVLKEIGYDGVELFVRNPQEIDIDLVADAIEHSMLEVAAIGTGPVITEDGLSFTSADSFIRAESIARTKSIIDLAALFGAPVIIGKLRGDLQSENRELSLGWMEEAFVEVCDYAINRNVNIAIEAQNLSAVNNMNTVMQALDWINYIDAPNLHVILDSYHMDIEEASISAGLIEAGEQLIHMHFSGKKRGIPGQCGINFPELVRVLQSIKYDRFISVEIEQKPNSFQAALASFEYLHPIISSRS